MAVIAAVTVGSAFPAAAEERRACSDSIGRTNVVQCVLAASLGVRREQETIGVLEGRRSAVRPLLPSNPVLGFSAARRGSGFDAGQATNWYATLSQEVEIAGQRGARTRAVDAELAAQERRVSASARSTAARAWEAYFEAVSAVEEVRVARLLEGSAHALSTVTRARAERGLLAAVDGDVAEASEIRLGQARIAAEQHAAETNAVLATLVGRDPTRGAVTLEGRLVPLDDVEAVARQLAPRAPNERLDVRALEAERQALESRGDAYRRARIPNVTVSVFAQNDGFNEKVLGAGLSLPLPLPQPVGRTYAGEIAESEALARRTATDVEALGRSIRLEIATALSVYDARRAELALFAPERIARAQTALANIAAEIEAGRLALRDALVAQQTLIELLRAHVDAQRALCLASVELARVTGAPLERGAQ